MKLILAAAQNELFDAWSAAFDGLPDVSVHSGSIFDVACDAMVSPANSFGFMDGGIDMAYSQRLGWQVQDRVRRAIHQFHHGELLVGSAEIVETDAPNPPFLIAAPTMRVPMVLGEETVNPYLATRAVLLLVASGTFSTGRFKGEPVAARVQTLAFPGMGTGVGRVKPAVCARQMRAAYDACANPGAPLPSSWAEASELHQLLYTDRPRRLQ